MRPGSVIVDLAAEAGGNCQLTSPARGVHNGVTIVGTLNLPSDMPLHASQMYARNIGSLLATCTADGEPAIDFEDEIVADACITHDGRVVLPAARRGRRHERPAGRPADGAGAGGVRRHRGDLEGADHAAHAADERARTRSTASSSSARSWSPASTDSTLVKVLGTIAVAFGAINVVGGFLVTDRMLNMFKRRPGDGERDG